MSSLKSGQQVLVPIVGRPNVGKSTLFNRLIGEERALTGSQPGVTRDRLAKTMHWDDKVITLVDTAGYQPEHPAPAPEFVLEQVKIMIEEGELILFVLDGREEITQLDRRIIEKLRPVSNQVVAVINKIDPGNDLQLALTDYYSLGFKNLIPVSAQHKRNLSPLRKKIVELAPAREPISDEEEIKLSLIGRPNVGKSTLFNEIVGYDRTMVSDTPGTTRDVVDISFKIEDQRFHLTDTVGIRRKSNIDEELETIAVMRSLKAIDFCDIACLMLDWNQRVTKQDQRLAGLILDRYRGCLLLVNKADQPDEDNEHRWIEHINERLHFLKYAPVIFTSGLQRRSLTNIFSSARAIYRQLTRWVPEEELHNSFLDLKPKISWPSSGTHEVILKQIRQLDVNPPTFEIEANQPRQLRQQDLRHLRQLLRKQLELYWVPLKLKLVEEFD